MSDSYIIDTLKDIENKYVTNVEDNFNLYLLEDISEAGEITDLFDSESWYLYYLSCALPLKRLIEYLLRNSDGNREYLIQSIKLKRIIDERLLYFGNGDYDMINRNLELSHSRNSSPLFLNDQLVTPNFLPNLWFTLKEKAMINSSFEDFTSNFEITNQLIKIKWIGRQIMLVGFFKYLITHKYIVHDSQKPYLLINKHFSTDKGLPYKEASLSVNYSQVLNQGNLSDQVFLFVDKCNSNEKLQG